MRLVPTRRRGAPSSSHRVGVVAALVAGSVVLASATGYTATQAVLDDGGTWLEYEDDVRHVNEGTGRVDDEVTTGLEGSAEATSVTEGDDGTVAVVDGDNGRGVVIDPASTADPVPVAVGPAGGDIPARQLRAADSLFLFTPGSSDIVSLDPTDLRTIATVDVGAPVVDAVIDDTATVWALVEGGTIVAVTPGAEVAERLSVAAGDADLLLTVVDGDPVVVDLDQDHAVRIDAGSRRAQPPVPLGTNIGDDAALASADSTDPALWLLIPSRSSLLRVDLAGGDAELLTLAEGDEFRGRPVVHGGHAYVIDGRDVRVIDLETQEARVRRIEGTGTIEMFVDGDSVWINDPEAAEAVRFDVAGVAFEVDKRTGAERRVDEEAEAAAARPTPEGPTAPTGGDEVDPGPIDAAPVEAPPVESGPVASDPLPPAPITPGPTSPAATPPAPTPPAPGPVAPVEVAVPDLVGSSRQAACAQLQNVRLVCAAEPVTTRPSGSTAARDEVLTQSPAAATSLETGRSVTVRFYAPDPIAVPAVASGATVEQACAAMQAVGFVCEQVDDGAAPADVPAGTVAGVDPAPGTTLDPGETVTVRYHATAPVPDLDGLTPEAARAAVERLRLTYAEGAPIETRPAGDTRERGTVLAQSPAAATAAEPGAAVTVQLLQPPTVTVPDSTGTYDTTCGAVQAAGLTCTAAAQGPGPVAGGVTSLSPGPGETVERGTAVTIAYNESTDVPNVVGQDVNAACGAIAARGLTCQPADGGPAPSGVAVGTTTAQDVPAGTQVGAGQTVIVSYYARAAETSPLYLHRLAGQGDIWILSLAGSVPGYDYVNQLGTVYREPIGTHQLAVQQCSNATGIVLFTVSAACETDPRWVGPTQRAGWYVSQPGDGMRTVYRRLRGTGDARHYVWTFDQFGYEDFGFADGNEEWGVLP